MPTWLAWVLKRCLQLIRWMIQSLTRPARRRWGCSGMASRPRKFRAHPKPQWVRREIIRMKAVMPEAGCRTIAHHFNRRFAVRRQMTVGKTYVASTIQRQQHLILEARRKLKHQVPRPVPRNVIWGCDLMVKMDQQGRSHLVLAILEHASRACLSLQRLPDKTAWTLLRQVMQPIQYYGSPRFVRTDNEACFTSGCFQLGLRLLGVRPQRIDPGCPWQNGRVERFIGTVKGLLQAEPLTDGEAFDRALRQVRRWYNHGRPHDHLQGRTPAEVWAGVDVFAARSHRMTWADAWKEVRLESSANSG